MNEYIKYENDIIVLNDIARVEKTFSLKDGCYINITYINGNKVSLRVYDIGDGIKLYNAFNDYLCNLNNVSDGFKCLEKINRKYDNLEEDIIEDLKGGK